MPAVVLIFCCFAWGFLPALAQAAAQEVPRPLYARPATTTTSFNVDAYAEYFDGLALQEAVALEGWTAGLDFTLPFATGIQVRFLLPLRTDAEGVLVNGGEDIDVKGWGGTFRFASLFFEHQVVGREGGRDRFGYFVGIGNRTAVLETGTPDRYNHRGRTVNVGVRYDRLLEGGSILLLDTELRFYEESDDLNPGNLRDDTFFLAKITAGWIGSARGALTPALELTADVVEGYVAVSVVPEVYLLGGRLADLKFGVPLGITSDAPDWGAQFRLTFTF